MPEGPFTAEQEARIAEIVHQLLLGAARHRHEKSQSDIDDEMSWARHWAGIRGPDDD